MIVSEHAPAESAVNTASIKHAKLKLLDPPPTPPPSPKQSSIKRGHGVEKIKTSRKGTKLLKARTCILDIHRYVLHTCSVGSSDIPLC